LSKTNIEWATEVWNPTTGCNKVSQGCKHCYAEVMHNRLLKMKPGKYYIPFLEGVVTHHDQLGLPLKWKTPRTVFVNSMSDLFHKDVHFRFIIDVFHIMSKCPQHTFMILTKRPQRMLEFMTGCTYNPYGSPYDLLPNVWLGVSVEDQAAANERIPLLLQVPAAVRFLSCEPLLGPVRIFGFNSPTWGVLPHGIDWVICGGESGSKARPMHPQWARSLRDQCADAGVPFFFKQWGEWWEVDQMPHDATGFLYKKSLKPDGNYFFKVGKHKAARLLDGTMHNEFPQAVKEFD